MSARFSIQLLNSGGSLVVDSDVDLYSGASPSVPGAHTDMTNNSDGTYYCSVSASGVYTVVVDGSVQDEFQGIYIAVDDSVLDSDLTLHVNADGAGGTSTPATNKVHNAAAIELEDTATRFTATDVEAGLAELAGSGRTTETVKANNTAIGTVNTAIGTINSTITAMKGTSWGTENLVEAYDLIGDMSFTTSPWLKALSSPDVCDCLRELDLRSWSNYQNIINAGGGGITKKEISIFIDTDDIGHGGSAIEVHQMRFSSAMIVDRIQFYNQGTAPTNDAIIYCNTAQNGTITYDSGRVLIVGGDGLVYADSGAGLGINIPNAYYMGVAFRSNAAEGARLHGNIIVTMQEA